MEIFQRIQNIRIPLERLQQISGGLFSLLPIVVFHGFNSSFVLSAKGEGDEESALPQASLERAAAPTTRDREESIVEGITGNLLERISCGLAVS